ncbi:MAG: HNH endonuclease signature motif containing protein [Thiobacillus sp.]|uniref:HNH endonuclease n=1 Tax=Thiobacillus sp. TaxID=924 RepID=UPI002733673E|nr:HNH endonuclease signature motif containing protein [Thiobacillus sp.]MDP3586059.1 HNH endonuclease signature motif containing protein [Thiobacillus sp.]
MSIQVSAALRKKLPEGERTNIEQSLLNKSGGECFLCGQKLIEATQKLVADHDIPEAEGGKTELSNLNLVHEHCNSFKRSHPTVNVRPYLKLTEKIRAKGGFLKYDEAVALLDISPTPVDIVIKGSTAEITTPDNVTHKCPVFTETNKEGPYKFCFCELPANAIFNDDECQPRTVKVQHLWQIYSDISRNPLHEAPACRLKKIGQNQQSYQLALFDGQHKALSFWVAGRKSVVVKVYLDLTKEQAVRLVNSVQSKIKKLPLSPFELAAKMADEWQERVTKYEEAVGTNSASEAGFLKWVETDERTRAKSALEEAILETIVQDDRLELKKMVARPGEPKESGKLTEAAFRNKVLKPLVHMAPLGEFFIESQKYRERELNNIVTVLNVLYAKAFGIAQPSPQEEIRAKRLIYQSAINFTAGMLRKLIGHRLASASPRELLEKEPNAALWTAIEADVARYLDHPVWTTPFDSSQKMKAVQDALSKNQDAGQAFGAVGLKLGYIVGVDQLDPNWNA